VWLYECLCGALWSCPVGEPYVVNLEGVLSRFGLEEGAKFKASIAWGSSLFPNNCNHTIHIACVFLLRISYYWSYTLSPMVLHWVAYASAPLNHDLVIWLMEYAINIKRGVFSNFGKESTWGWFGSAHRFVDPTRRNDPHGLHFSSITSDRVNGSEALEPLDRVIRPAPYSGTCSLGVLLKCNAGYQRPTQTLAAFLCTTHMHAGFWQWGISSVCSGPCVGQFFALAIGLV